MSYDILFVRPSGGADVLAEVRTLADSEFDEETESEPSEDADRRRKTLVNELLALHPSLTMESDDFSTGCWVGSDADECPLPSIEVGVDSGMVSLPYSTNTEEGFSAIEPIVTVFARHGYAAYDPQTDSLIDLRYMEAAKTQHAETAEAVVSQLQSHGESVISPRPLGKPWWAFWRRS